MKQILRMLIILLMIFSCQIGVAQKKILFATGGGIQPEFVQRNNLINIVVFYQGEFVDKTGLKFDPVTFLKFLDKRIPNKNQKGYATLDWEGKALAILSSKKSSKRQIKTVSKEFIKAIEFAKKERPNIKWSFYGLPSRNYWTIDKEWENLNLGLSDIFNKQDFISPSLYVLYLKDEQKETHDLRYIESNVSLALKIGHQLEKPVMPFIFHRSRTPNKKFRDALVDIELWEFYLENILNCEYKGKRVDGLIWWNSETYNYVNRSQSIAMSSEYERVTDVSAHQLNLFTKYLSSIRKFIK